MNLVLVDEAVVVRCVSLCMVSCPCVVLVQLVRGVLLGERAVVSGFELEVVGYLVLIVEFHLEAAVLSVRRTVLISVFYRMLVVVEICDGVLMDVGILAVPFVSAYCEVDGMGVGEVMAVVEHSVDHIHRTLACGSAEHFLCRGVNSVYYIAIEIRSVAP